MGCGCNKRKQDLDSIRSLAIIFLKTIKEDVRLYTYTGISGAKEYNFERTSGNTGVLVEILKYEDFSDSIPPI